MSLYSSVLKKLMRVLAISLVTLALATTPAGAQDKKPNIVMLMTDDTAGTILGPTVAALTSAIRRRTSIALPRKEPYLQVGMVRRVVLPAAPRS
jgi:hypothetical protein